jgi:DNA-binding NarL/FixJ family response regulator
MFVDRDIHLARALLIDGSPLMRSTTAAQLRTLGVGYIAQAGKGRDARTLIEREPFDIVVCSRDLDGSDAGGQDFLDELRREGGMPPECVVVMIAQQATYAQVVEAGEAALDVFLVRPYSAEVLAERLAEARQRKRVLADIFRALQAGEPQNALLHAIRRFQERAAYWVYCGRIAGELLLKLDKPGEARKVFERLQDQQPAAWARLGIARSQLALGEIGGAKKQIQAVQAEDPDNADAHDLMGRLMVEQCDFAGALDCYREAARLTPDCLLRTQHAGALAFYQGQPEEALGLLLRAQAMGRQSRLFDTLTLMLLALLRHDGGDPAELGAMRENLEQWQLRHPGSRRLGRFVQAARGLEAMLRGADEASIRAAVAPLHAEIDDDGFDLEAANLLLAVTARLPAHLRRPGELAALAERLGQRHCTSRAMAEVMVAAARQDDEAEQGVRRAQTAVTALAEQAMERAMAGAADEAARELLEHGERLRNTRLLETGAQLARRYRAGAAEALATRATGLIKRWGSGAQHIAGIQRSGRTPGGLQLRGLSA